MSFDPTDYVPHGMVAVVATVAAWVFRDHAKRDDARFTYFNQSVEDVKDKLDKAVATAATNHAEILKILLKEKHG
jgi:hypothetical protein